MKCISIRQPWAWAIFHGKDIENRSWSTRYRCDLLIHASTTFDPEGIKWIDRNFPGLIPEHVEFRQGCIIGKAKLIDCVYKSSSPWFFGPCGFVFSDPVLFKKTIPYRGMLKLFDVPDELIKCAICANSQTDPHA